MQQSAKTNMGDDRLSSNSYINIGLPIYFNSLIILKSNSKIPITYIANS